MVCPLPSTVRLCAIAGRLPPIVIVPLTLKLIVSVPVAIAQAPPVVSEALFALLMASRRVQNPLPEMLAGSVGLLTVMMFEVALRPVVKNIRLHGSRTASRTTMNFSDVRAPERLVSLEIAERKVEQTESAIRRIKQSLPFGSWSGLVPSLQTADCQVCAFSLTVHELSRHKLSPALISNILTAGGREARKKCLFVSEASKSDTMRGLPDLGNPSLLPIRPESY